MDLKDEQWAIVEPFLPKPSQQEDGKGRPRVDDRAILNGIYWVLRTGAPCQKCGKPGHRERCCPRAREYGFLE